MNELHGNSERRYHNFHDISAHLPAVKADVYSINAGVLTIVESKD